MITILSNPGLRSLFYRQTPKVEAYQSRVHELFLRPHNYVSYQMGRSGGGAQYKYQYETQHPQLLPGRTLIALVPQLETETAQEKSGKRF